MSAGFFNFKFARKSSSFLWVGTLTFGKMSVILDIDSHSLVSGKEMWMSQLAATREWHFRSRIGPSLDYKIHSIYILYAPYQEDMYHGFRFHPTGKHGKHRSPTHPTIHPKSISPLGFLHDCRFCCQIFLEFLWLQLEVEISRPEIGEDEIDLQGCWTWIGEDGTITALRKDGTWSN